MNIITNGVKVSANQMELIKDLFLGQKLVSEMDEKDFKVMIQDGSGIFDCKSGSITAHPVVNDIIDNFNSKYIGKNCGIKSML